MDSIQFTLYQSTHNDEAETDTVWMSDLDIPDPGWHVYLISVYLKQRLK